MACQIRGSLDDLPDELILYIICDLDTPSLARLGVASRRFHRLTHEQLYASYEGHGMAKFLRTIAASPALGSAVKTAAVTIPDVEVIDEQDREIMIAALKQLPVPAMPEKQKFMEYLIIWLRTGDRPADFHWYMEVLLQFVPNLESLVIHDAWRWYGQDEWFLTTAILSDRIHHLRSVTLHGPMQAKQVRHVLRLPAVKEVTLHQLIEGEGGRFDYKHWDAEGVDMSWMSNWICDSGVTHLRIKNSYVDDFILLHLLDWLPALEHFEYEHICPEHRDPADAFDMNPDYDRLAQTFACTQAGTLTSFVLRNRLIRGAQRLPCLVGRWFWEPEGLTTYAPTLPLLRHLDMDFVFGGGQFTQPDDSVAWANRVDMERWVARFVMQLARPLETLRLAICFKWTYQDEVLSSWFMRCLALQGEWEARSVRSVVIESILDPEDCEEGLEQEFEETRKVFKEKGVRFEHEVMDWPEAHT